VKPSRSRGKRAFVDVNVIDVTHGEVLEHQTVILDGDRISAVGPSNHSSIEPGVRTLGRGGYLMPGLVDLHVHLSGEADMLLYLLNGVTTVRNMWGLAPHLVWRSAVEKGRLLGPTVYTTGPIADGRPPIWNMAVSLSNADEAAREVRRQKEAGFSAVKVYNNLSREAYESLVREAAHQGLPVVGHIPYAIGLDDALRAKQRSIEHLDGWLDALSPKAPWLGRRLTQEERPRVLEFLQPEMMPSVASRIAHSDSWSCVTLEVWERFASPAEVAERLSLPEMKLCPPALIASWDPRADFRIRSVPPQFWEMRKQLTATRREIVRQLRSAGAKILVGTDTPNPWVVPGFSLHNELDHLIDCGYTVPEVLRMATETAGEFLGQPGEFGVVRSGARADLIWLADDPLEDVSRVRRPKGVMVRGHWLPRTELGRISNLLLRSYSTVSLRLKEAVSRDAPSGSLPCLTYQVSAFDRLTGMERIWLSPAGAPPSLEAQLVLDAAPGEVSVRTSWTFDEATRVREMRTRIQMFEGKFNVVLNSNKRGFAVRENTKGASGGLTGTVPVPADSILGGVQVASWIPVLAALRSVRPDHPFECETVRVEVESVQVAHGHLNVQVAPPGESESRSETPLQLSLEERWQNGQFSGAMELGADGSIHTFRWLASTTEMKWILLDGQTEVRS